MQTSTKTKRLQEMAAAIGKHKVLRAVLTAFLLNLILESLCRRSVLGGLQFLVSSPLPFIYGTGIILLTVSLVGLVRRRQFALLLISVIWIGLGIVECVLKGFRVTPLTAVDFRIIFSVFSILNVYLNPFEIVLIVVTALAVLAGLVLGFLKLPKGPPVDYLRAGFLCMAVGTVLWVSTIAYLYTGLLPTEMENLSNAYDAYGFPFCFCTSIFQLFNN